MSYRWLLNPKWLLFIPLLVVLVIGVACGGDEAISTPQATATPVPAAPAATATAVPAGPAATATAVPAGPAATATAVPAGPAATATAVPAGPAATATATAVPAGPAATATAVPAGPAATATAVPAAPAATATPVPVAEPTPTAEPVMAKLEPRYGEIIPMSAQSSPALIHPVTTSLAEGLYVSGPIYSQLVRYDPLVHRGAEIIGDVAKSWEVSDDGLVYTFGLHENVRFTDGEDLDADDVAFTINHILEPGAARPVTGKLRPYVDRAEKIDKYTVAIHLKFPTSAFIKILAIDFMKIMPQHVIEAGVDLELFENMVGSGPFKGVSYTVGNNWEHEKNPDYFREGLPYFRRPPHLLHSG